MERKVVFQLDGHLTLALVGIIISVLSHCHRVIIRIVSSLKVTLRGEVNRGSLFCIIVNPVWTEVRHLILGSTAYIAHYICVLIRIRKGEISVHTQTVGEVIDNVHRCRETFDTGTYSRSLFVVIAE